MLGASIGYWRGDIKGLMDDIGGLGGSEGCLHKEEGVLGSASVGLASMAGSERPEGAAA